ncbi:MAG: phage tail tape measure protein, partial [Thermoguttaceae bacterium]|nr:phage tail tape measure protein [Thermoguttaceae bacterium]
DASAAVEGFLRKQNESIREVSALSGAWLGMLKESLGGLMSSFAATGDQFDKMSQRTGISTGALSEYAHAAQMCGSDIQTVESALKNMASQLVQAQSGSARALTNFERLGIDVEQFSKLTPEEQFDTLAAAIAKIEDPTERAGAALKIFGSAGQQLLPLFTSGSEGLAAMREEARKLGVSVDESTAKLGAEYTDAMTRVKQSLAGVGMTIAASLAPQITEFANWLSSVVAKVRQWIGEHRELTRTIIAVGTGLTGVAATVWGFQKALTGVSSAVAQFSSLIGTNPVLAVLGAVAGAAVYGAMKFNDYCKAQNEALNGGGWSDVAKREFEAGERLREQDVQRFERLKQLSAQENLTTLEIQEAVKLAAELQARYGDVGIAVDAVAGKIRIADGAQAKMNERMAAASASARYSGPILVRSGSRTSEEVPAVKRCMPADAEPSTIGASVFGKRPCGRFRSNLWIQELKMSVIEDALTAVQTEIERRFGESATIRRHALRDFAELADAPKLYVEPGRIELTRRNVGSPEISATVRIVSERRVELASFDAAAQEESDWFLTATKSFMKEPSLGEISGRSSFVRSAGSLQDMPCFYSAGDIGGGVAALFCGCELEISLV